MITVLNEIIFFISSFDFLFIHITVPLPIAFYFDTKEGTRTSIDFIKQKKTY